MAKINIVFKDGDAVTRTADNSPSKFDPFMEFICNSIDVPSSSLSDKDLQEIRTALMKLINNDQEVTIKLDVSKRSDPTPEFATVQEFLLHFLKKTDQRVFYIHYETWEDIRKRLETLLIGSKQFKKVVFWNTERARVIEIGEGGVTTEAKEDVQNVFDIIKRLKGSKNTAFIWEDGDKSLLAHDDMETINQRHALREIFSNGTLKSNGSALIFAVIANSETQVPIELSGYFKSFRATGLEFPILQRIARDLTAEAAAGKLGDVRGRDDVIRRIADILNQRTANNPMLIGLPGSGKTAIVEGLAVKIHKGEIEDDNLKKKRIFELSYAKLIGGTCSDQELATRIQDIVAEVKKNKDRVVIFIDEFHLLVEGGGGERSFIGNILKPELARGDFPLIGATTEDEFQRFLGKDDALKQRFVKVRVDELPEDIIKEIFREFVDKSNAKTGKRIKISDDTIDVLYKLSASLNKQEALPRSALKILDRLMGSLKEDSEVTRRLVQMEFPLGRISMNTRDGQAVQKIREKIRERIIGRDEVINRFIRNLFGHYRDLGQLHKPFCALLMGPTGTGKTEFGYALSEALFGSDKHVFNDAFGHYKGEACAWALIGAPPGYVGFEGGAPLPNWLSQHEYGIIILDELEKAHSSALDVLLDFFDKGEMKDNHGRKVNTLPFIFLMTSNIGQELDEGQGLTQAEKTNILLANNISAPFIGRLDFIDFFDRWSLDKVMELIKKMVEVFNKTGIEKVRINLTTKAIERVARNADFRAFGARNVQQALLEFINGAILDHRLSEGEYIIDVDDQGGQVVTKK